MNVSFWIAVILQIILVIWLLSSLQIRKVDYHFFDNDSTLALKGFFSIIIVLFHVPTSNVLCNLLGCVSAVIIVTMFSFFSTYGMTVKARLNKGYIGTVPYRFARIAVLYFFTLMIKHFITGNKYSGGILWINSLLLSYVVFYVIHLVFKGYSDYIVIAFGYSMQL